MKNLHPELDFLRYLIFTLGEKIPKKLRILLLLILEFVFVYNIYLFVDKYVDFSVPKTVQEVEDRNTVNIDDLPIAYRKYYTHHNIEKK